MESYQKDLYTTPEAKEATALEQQIGKLLEQAGQTRKNIGGSDADNRSVFFLYSFLSKKSLEL